MSARSCQLCGKQLSRIWVGSDGDFCSREHRNQFRLRQGMGRLQEANKVANVMRRREQMKPLSNTRKSDAADVSRHGIFQLKIISNARPALRHFHIPLQLPSVQINGRVQGCIPPQASASQTEVAPRNALTVRFAARRRPQVTSQRVAKAPVRALSIAPARARVTSIPQAKVREFGMPRATTRRLVFPAKALKAASLRLQAAAGNSHTADRNRPGRGNVLRVSFACGIRVRKPQSTYSPVKGAVDIRLHWSERPTVLTAKAPEKAALLVSAHIPIPVAGVVPPRAPEPQRQGPRMMHAAVRNMSASAARSGTFVPRTEEKTWHAQTDFLVLPEAALLNWQPGKTGTLPHIPYRPSAAPGKGQSKHTLAPFVPQDVPCGPSFNVGQNGNKDQKR